LFLHQALLKGYKTIKFVPFNPTDKYTCATVVEEATGKIVRLLKGSPQVVLKRAFNCAEIGDAVNNKMIEFANRGFRSLGIAMADGDGKDKSVEDKWTMLGLMPLFDPPRHDTKSTIEKCITQASGAHPARAHPAPTLRPHSLRPPTSKARSLPHHSRQHTIC
jgi:H+-transporting ATPase